MSIWRLVTQEILHRKVNFVLAVLAILVAVGVLVAELTLLRAHDIRTQAILKAKETETAARLRVLEDDYRKIMLKLGFNILILPKGQDLGDLYTQNYSSSFMPEEYADKLANSNIMTVQHLLPILEQHVTWDEQKRKIVLDGVRDEVPLPHRDKKKPLVQPVPPGAIILGYELWHSLALKVGDRVTLKGRQFTVHQCYPERGNKDDVTAWINLHEAQEMLGRKGQINAIMALDCLICFGTALSEVRKEITRILPDTQVRELDTRLLVRAEARQRAAEEHKQALAAEADHRAGLRAQKEAFAAWLVPLVVLGAAAWLTYLAFANVRERTTEIGVLRAIGVRLRDILMLFLARAVLLGVVGAAAGVAVGLAIGWLAGNVPFTPELFGPVWLLGVLIMASAVLAALASWAPAAVAARQDPAVVLREE